MYCDWWDGSNAATGFVTVMKLAAWVFVAGRFFSLLQPGNRSLIIVHNCSENMLYMHISTKRREYLILVQHGPAVEEVAFCIILNSFFFI